MRGGVVQGYQGEGEGVFKFISLEVKKSLS